MWGGDTGLKFWVGQFLEFRLSKGYIYSILRAFKSKTPSGTSTPPPDSLTDFLSDLDRSPNWFLEKVGDVLGRNPPIHPGYATEKISDVVSTNETYKIVFSCIVYLYILAL